MISISGATRVVVVIGDPIDHTRSPAMLNAAFAATGLDYVMVPLHVRPRDLPAAIRGLAATGVVGASVTVPHKTAVVPLCTELAPAAAAIGAANCLAFPTAGTIVGDNTDGPGFVAALAAATGSDTIATVGRRAAVLGAGGAAIAVAGALAHAGVAVALLARRSVTVPAACRLAAWEPAALEREFSTADLVVDCTPVGLDPAAEPAFVDALPLDRLPPRAVVASLIYHREPLLLARARARGHVVVDGSGMLVRQGALAFARWTGRAAPVDVMIEALRALRTDGAAGG
jgi:shikimate dehydrogenase